MEWTEDGLVLAVRKHGETGAVVHLLTADRGRHAGLVHGGAGRRMRPMLQPGNSLRAHWRGRLEDHLGVYTLEPVSLRAATWFDNGLALAGLEAACALAFTALPEREPHPGVYHAMEVLFQTMGDDELWPALFVRWEMGLLQEMGFGLDLSRCASTGSKDDLTHVSPRSGRAVSRAAAEPYEGRLLDLPPFLLGSQVAATTEDVQAGLKLTAHFLQKWVYGPQDRPVPEARLRMAELLER